MRVCRALASVAFLIGHVTDSTRAMELFHDGQEAAELSRVKISSEASTMELRQTDHKIGCLHRRGLVAGRLRLSRRCQDGGVEDLRHDGPFEIKKPATKTPKIKKPDPPTEAGFENGMTRWPRAVKKAWSNFISFFRRRKAVATNNEEETVPLINEKVDAELANKLDNEDTRTLGQKVWSGFIDFARYMVKNKAPKGVVTGDGTIRNVPHWAVGRFQKPWTEMDDHSVQEMRDALKSVDLEELTKQLTFSASPRAAELGPRLGHTSHAEDDLLNWAMGVLVKAPAPEDAVTPVVREELVLAVKSLYVYGSQTKPTSGLLADRAREFLASLDKSMRNNPTYTGQGISKYIHAAYTGLPPRTLADEVVISPAIQSKLVHLDKNKLYAKLKEIVDQNGFARPRDPKDMVVKSASAIEKARAVLLGNTPTTAEEAKNIEKNADWSILTLFYFSANGDQPASEKIEQLWHDWYNSGAPISSGLGETLEAAHNLVMIAKTTNRAPEDEVGAALAARFAQLKPTDWFGEFARSESSEVQKIFHLTVQRARDPKSPSGVFDPIIEWAGQKIKPKEGTSRFKRLDILFALDTLFTHSFSRDEATAKLAKLKLSEALNSPVPQPDVSTQSRVQKTYDIVTTAQTRPNWEKFDETLAKQVAQSEAEHPSHPPSPSSSIPRAD